MPTLPFRFLLVAVCAALCGMAAGIVMAASGDFTLAPAHAHLNLLGWVSMALYGLFYRAVPEASAGWLPKAHFWVATTGLVIMVPALGWLLLGHPGIEPVIGIGSLLTVAAMGMFGAVVLRSRQRVLGTSRPVPGSLGVVHLSSQTSS
ncbi:MAG: hypothetical protein J0H14_13420 [Alphaproteobacteria bacterium]|nr:hypothetical protein [Alphaproteobacteria bacterium]